MYAIVEIAGQQFKVKKDQKIFVHRLQEEVDSKVSFDKVLLLDDGKVVIGAPVIKGVAVSAKILSHLKGDKVIVFKKKRRKGYRVKNGHRQYLTEIKIESIVVSGAKSSKKEILEPVAKKEVPKETAKLEQEVVKKTITKADDLKKVEGIGPKIAEIFNDAGIVTFADLAATEVVKLKEILVAAGSRYASKIPDSWPKQAKMAATGKWDELKKWQDEIKGGIEK
ncbi:MAG: 50S ribosomal protein L21 [Flavobacteriaceae bacterium]|nr:50S ribosomal protein L21 [Flavobacteriaceae bacterium]